MKFLGFAIRRTLVLIIAAATVPTLASPGAHGLDGEHLDGPANAAGGAAVVPKMEAKSEQFELVATLGGGELSILIDRFETNEPVLNAQVEVESGALKAIAKFHADHGDYAVDDAALLGALRKPGEHPVIVTLVAGQTSDLLEGTLRVRTPVADTGDGHSHGSGEHGAAGVGHDHDVWRGPLLIAAAAVAFGLGGLWWWRRNRRTARIGAAK